MKRKKGVDLYMEKTTFELIYDVVNRLGEVSKAFAFGGENRQIALLENEGVVVNGNCVDLEKYRWNRVTLEMLEKELL